MHFCTQVLHSPIWLWVLNCEWSWLLLLLSCFRLWHHMSCEISPHFFYEFNLFNRPLRRSIRSFVHVLAHSLHSLPRGIVEILEKVIKLWTPFTGMNALLAVTRNTLLLVIFVRVRIYVVEDGRWPAQIATSTTHTNVMLLLLLLLLMLLSLRQLVVWMWGEVWMALIGSVVMRIGGSVGQRGANLSLTNPSVSNQLVLSGKFLSTVLIGDLWKRSNG